MSGMVKAYNQIVSVRIGNQIVSMSIVEKQNESGISYNERLFVLVHDSYFGYLSKVKMSEQPEKIKIEEAKVKIPIKNLYTAEAVDNMLRIKFTHEIDGKLVPKEWILRITTAKLAQLWKQLLDYQFKMRVKASSPGKDKRTNPGSRKSAEVNDSSKEKKSLQSSQIMKPEAAPEKQTINEPIVNSYSEAKPIQMTGSFDNSLFDDDSDEEDPKRRKKSARKSRTMNDSSPPKEDRNINEQGNTAQAKSTILSLQQPVNKIEQAQLQPKDEHKYQIAKDPPEETSLRKNQKESPTKRSRIEDLSLPQIIQQPESTPKKSQTKSIRQSAGKFEENIDFPPTQKNMASSGKKASLRSEEMRRASVRQQQLKSKSLTAEEKDLALIAQIVRQLQQKNERFPFKQIAYDHNQFQTFFRPYKDKLSSTNSNQIERIMNAVLDQMRDRQYIAADSIANSQRNWIYRQITQDEATVILDFHNHCKDLMKSLVLELHSHNFLAFKKIKQEQQFIYLSYQDLEIKVPLILMTENKKDPSIKVLQIQAQKAVKNQFKGLQYLHRLIENRGQLRVPLSCLCEYGGIVALFKAKGVFYENDKYSELLNRQLQRLQDLSSLPLSTLLKNCIRPLNQFYYNQMRRGQTNINFRFHLVVEINKLFILDVQATRQSPSKVLRMELLQKEINRKVLPFVQIEDLQTNREISGLISKMQQKIHRVTASINNLQFLFVSPKELSDLLHSQGISMRNLVQIYLKTEDQFAKSLILSELMARTIKKLLSKTLQDICLEEKNQYKNIQQMEYALKTRITDFLNCLFGNNLETEALWQLVSANARRYYSAQIQNYQNVSKGQLLISLAYHCSLSLSWRDINATEIFRSSKVISIHKLKSIEPKIKSYKPSRSSKIEALNQRMQSETTDNFDWIVSSFNLNKQRFPPELVLQQVSDRLRLFLCSFIEPDQLDWQNSFSHLSLYLTDEPTTLNFRIDMAAVKWYLRKGNKYKYLNKFNEITSKITRLYGNNHPFLSQLYEVFSNDHRSKGQIEDAISFMKSSLLNISAISGDSNKLMTEKCFRMFELLKSSSRENEAYEYLNKAKRIIENSPSKKVSLYGKIKLELGNKAFREHRESEALKQLQNVSEYFQIYEKEQTSFQEERTRLYQLLYLCKEKLNKRAELGQLCSTLENKLKYFQNHRNFQEILWILIQNVLKSNQHENKQAFLKLINQLKISRNVGLYKKALVFVQKRYSEKCLFSLLRKYCENAPKVVGMVAEAGILKDWQPLASVHQRQSLFDFVSLAEELTYLFGKDRLNSIQSSE